MIIKLIKDVLANGLDKSYRENLVSNFTIIEDALNQALKIKDDIESDLKKKFDDQDKKVTQEQAKLTKDLTARINRIVLGTDDEAIRAVVTEILRGKGVIK